MNQKNAATLTLVQLILPLYLPTFLLSVAQSTMIPVLPLFADSFHAGYGWIGLVLAGESIGMLVGDIPAGMLQRKYGARTTMLFGVLIWALSAICQYFSGHIALIFLFQMIGGFGFSFYGMGRLLMISERLAAENRGQAVSLIGGVFRMGRVIGPVTGGLFAGHFELRSAYLFFFAIVMLTFVVVRLFMPQIYPVDAEHTSTKLKHVFKGQASVFLTAGTGQFLLSLLRSGPRVIIPLYGANMLGLGVDQIGSIISIAAILDVALFIPAGWIMDHLGRKFSVIPSVALLGLCLFLIPFTGGYMGLLWAAIVGGVGNGISSGFIMTMGADLAPQAIRGEFLGIWRLIGDGGTTSSPLILGGLADLVSLAHTSWIMSAFGLVAVVLFAFRVPETLKAPIWRRRKRIIRS